MPAKKPGYSLEQHDQLGLEIQTIHDRMLTISADLSKHYPAKGKNGKACQLTEKMIKNLVNFKGEMDKLVAKEQLGAVDTESIYYRASRADHIKNPGPIRPFPQE